MNSMSGLQAAAGRFLANSGPMAWEHDSQQRHVALVHAFQTKMLDTAGLQAALVGERSTLPTLPKAKPIALLQLVGILTPSESIFSMLACGTSVRGFMRDLTAANLDPTVKAIAIVVDSPGGSIRMLPEASALMRGIRRRKPVVVSVAAMNASAAYWLTSGATIIESTPSASIGAIGVTTSRISIAKQLEKDGVDVEVFSAGKFKSEGHEALAITEPERKAKQAEVNEAYREFVMAVYLGRHTPASAIIAGYGEGRLVSATSALELGMIDGISLVEDTIGRTLAAPAAELSAVFTQRVQVFADHLEAAEQARGSAEITEHRRALVAAVRGGLTP